MESNYIGVYEDTRPEWRKYVEARLLYYASEWEIPVVILYDFLRFLEFYIPDDFDYLASTATDVDFYDGKLDFTCKSSTGPEVIRFTMLEDYSVSVVVYDSEAADKILTRLNVSVRNYYNEALKAITKKLFKS